MKVILLADNSKLGKKGDIVEVAEGYGRNFLLPKKLAEEASAANVNRAKATRANEVHRAAREKDEAIVLKAQVEKVTVRLKVKMGENGRMFGSVTSKDVAAELVKQTGIEIDRRKVELKDMVKGPGSYAAQARLHPDASASFKVIVEVE
ncbi:MAG: 50S ribosomal protein L9 [Phascolarctobacterium sp.]|nr:50S ribosomal protein L9 [Phascolarctobacterium sp.]